MRSIAIILFISLVNAFAAIGQEMEIHERKIIAFLDKNYKLPSVIISSCEWQCAVVLLKTNRSNKVDSIEVLNQFPGGDFAESFKIMKSLSFYPEDKMGNKDILFLFTIDKMCDGKQPLSHNSPSITLTGIMQAIGQQLKSNPQTVFINHPLIFVNRINQH